MSNEFDYTKLKHVTSVDQSDREVPYNLRQSGPTKVEMLISTRVRKSPYWHLSMQAGCWRATVYNRIYHPRGYVKPEDGGAMVEYDAIVNHVTMWNVAVERQIRVKGPDAEKFTDYVITRDATKISPMRARYVILCNQYGGVLNDPILLRISKDEFWFSLSDSDIGLYLQGVNHDNRFDVTIDEIDEALNEILEDNFFLDKRTRVTAVCGDKEFPPALNEIYISRANLTKTAQIEIKFQNDTVKQKMDGVIIATPSGSTGHSFSLGGPILHESLDVLIITPVAPVYRLASLVVPDEKIEVISSHDCNIAIDAQVVKSAGYEEPIIIKKYKSPAVFIRLKKRGLRQMSKLGF